MLAIILFFGLVGVACAQNLSGFAVNPDSGPTGTQSRLPSSVAEIDALLVKVETQLSEIRAAQSNLPPREVAAEERVEHERLYLQWAIAVDSQARSLRLLKDIRRLNDEHAAEARNWRGFNEDPSYSVVDRFLDQIATQKLKVDSHQMILAISTDDITRESALLENARRSFRLAQDEVDALGTPDLRQSWLVGLAQTRVRVHEAAIQASELKRLVILEGLTGQRDYIAFLTQRLETAQGLAHFTTKDYDIGVARIHEVRERIQQELNAAILSDADIQAALALAQGNLKNAQTNSISAAPMKEIRAMFDAAQARSETSEFKVDLLRNLLLMSDFGQTLWQDRLWVVGNHSVSELKQKRVFYQESLSKLVPWKEYVFQNLSAAASQALIQAVAARESNLSTNERSAAKETQAALEERAMLYQRALAAIVLVENSGRRLMDDITAKESRMTFGGKVWLAVDVMNSLGKRIWSTELYVAEDSVLSDGRKISVARSITVGKVIIALTIFFAGLAVARIGHGITKRSMLRWFKLEERTAGLFGESVGTVLALIALFVAMAAVRIPWTVFAFVGGALAIGVGFGAQTLINNFISGLILLFERSIRVGDIIEVDEQRGRIERIGIRNSLIQRGDGIEIIVPNSRFLEKNVVNWTLSNTLVRYGITLGVAYGSPTRKVADLITQVALAHKHVLQTPAPEVLFEEFGDNALQFTLKFWMHLSTADGGTVRSELRHAINTAFEQAGIVLAFPQRDVHLDTTKPLEIKVVNPPQTMTPPFARQ